MPKTFNLADLLEVVCESVPERIAFVCGEQQLSFRQLNSRANKLADALRQMGIRRGDHVGIELYNSAAYLEAFLRAAKLAPRRSTSITATSPKSCSTFSTHWTSGLWSTTARLPTN